METFNIDTLDDFTRAYMECALWSSNDTVNGEEVNLNDEHGIEDIHPATRDKMVADCKKFQEENIDLLRAAYLHYRLPSDGQTMPQDMAGHDFWLTRNGHGAGFWDRGLGDIGEKLTALCGWKKAYPEVSLCIGDDGKIHAE